MGDLVELALRRKNEGLVHDCSSIFQPLEIHLETNLRSRCGSCVKDIDWGCIASKNNLIVRQACGTSYERQKSRGAHQEEQSAKVSDIAADWQQRLGQLCQFTSLQTFKNGDAARHRS